MKKVISLLVLVLLVSGCTQFDIFNRNQDVKEISDDVITVENVKVLPTPPLNPDDYFTISFQLVNNDEKKDVPVFYEILDDGMCNLVTLGDKSGNFDDNPLVPGQVEFKEWTFKTPEGEAIGNIRNTCPIRFRIRYNFFSESEVEVNVISVDRYTYLQQTGEYETFTPTLVVGRGPIKIYMDLAATMPLRSRSKLPVYVEVKDKGTGLMKEVPPHKLVVQVPNEFVGEDDNCGVLDNVTVMVDNTYFMNNAPIPFISKETFKIKCTFTAPDVDLEQTYFMNAYFLDYSYDIIEQVDVSVEPLP